MKNFSLQTTLSRFWQPIKALFCVAWLYPIYWITLDRQDGFFSPITVLAAMPALWAFMDSIDDHGFISFCCEEEPRRHLLRRTDWLLSLAVSAVGGGLVLGLSVGYVLTGLKLQAPWIMPLCFLGGGLIALGCRALMIHLLFHRWSGQSRFYHEGVVYPKLRTRVIQSVVFGVSLLLVALLGLSNLVGGVYTLAFGAVMLIGEFLWPIVAVILLFFAIRRIRLLVSRGKFLKRLKKMQERGEIHYDYEGHPYLSVLFRRVYFGLLITDYTDGRGAVNRQPKKYRVAVVGTVKRRLLVACEHDTYQIKHEIRLRLSLGGAVMASHSGAKGTGVVLRTWYTTHGVAYPGSEDEAGDRVIVFDPAPYGIFIRSDDGRDDLTSLDNGSKAYGYTVWTKNSFANYLERT